MEGSLLKVEIGFLWLLAADNLQLFAQPCLNPSCQDVCSNSFCVLWREICVTFTLQKCSYRKSRRELFEPLINSMQNQMLIKWLAI